MALTISWCGGRATVADARYGIGYWVLHLSGATQWEHTSWRDWPLVVIL